MSVNKAWLDIALEVYHLFVKKNHDYSPNNIAKTGKEGVVIRMSDKIERLLQLTFCADKQKVSEESIRDTVMDIVDYGVIWLMLDRGLWPKYTRRIYVDKSGQLD